jgi:hypothetical protein
MVDIAQPRRIGPRRVTLARALLLEQVAAGIVVEGEKS